MSSPRVSVLLPVYNSEATLPRTLDSLLAQTCQDWELLAVDDGSTDATPEILRSAARRDPRIRPVSRPRTGLVAALNAGLNLARGVFVARLDADDTCPPNRLAMQAEHLDLHPAIGLVGGLVEFGGDPVTQAGYARHVDWLNSVITPEEIDRARFIEAPHAHPSVMFRRSLVEQHGGYRVGDFPEDYELWLRWLEQGVRMEKVRTVVLRWHDSPTRLSRTDPRYAPDAFFRVKAGYLARWLAREVPATQARWVWGAGRVTRRRLTWLTAEGTRIDGFLDVDPRKLGRHRDGRTVRDPDSLPGPGSVFVLGCVGSRGARELQRAYLEGRGYREGKDFLFAA